MIQAPVKFCWRFWFMFRKSFIFPVFGLYDKHVEVRQFLLLLAKQGWEMRGLDEKKTFRSHQDFQEWYQWIGDNITSNLHRVERIDVKLVGNGKYEVDLIVLWQALKNESQFVCHRGHQSWRLDDGNQGEWPRIRSCIVESL